MTDLSEGGVTPATQKFGGHPLSPKLEGALPLSTHPLEPPQLLDRSLQPQQRQQPMVVFLGERLGEDIGNVEVASNVGCP